MLDCWLKDFVNPLPVIIIMAIITIMIIIFIIIIKIETHCTIYYLVTELHFLKKWASFLFYVSGPLIQPPIMSKQESQKHTARYRMNTMQFCTEKKNCV